MQLSHVLAALLAAGARVDGALPKLLTSFELKNPAVTSLMSLNGSPALLVTTFDAPLAKDPVYLITDLASVVHDGVDNNATVLDDSMKWVNFIESVPSGTVEAEGTFVLAAGGFLVPTKSPGTVDLLDLSAAGAHGAAQRTTLNTAPSGLSGGYFYHDAVWADLNGDGRADVLTARAKQPIIGKKQGELVWLEQPASDPLSEEWIEHILVEGPDVAILFADLDGDEREELVATQFFTSTEIRVYFCGNDTAAHWADCEGSVESIAIPGTADLGPWFNIQRIDLDRDGTMELLVTSNRDDGEGTIYAIEVPADFRANPNAEWTLHRLASHGWKPAKGGIGKGAPGTARAFYERAEDERNGKRPSILMSTDDGGSVVLLTPNASAFGYDEAVLCASESKGTVGTPALGDIDGDGATELFVPFYSDGRIEVYSFA